MLVHATPNSLNIKQLVRTEKSAGHEEMPQQSCHNQGQRRAVFFVGSSSSCHCTEPMRNVKDGSPVLALLLLKVFLGQPQRLFRSEDQAKDRLLDSPAFAFFGDSTFSCFFAFSASLLCPTCYTVFNRSSPLEDLRFLLCFRLFLSARHIRTSTASSETQAAPARSFFPARLRFLAAFSSRICLALAASSSLVKRRPMLRRTASSKNTDALHRAPQAAEIQPPAGRLYS